jgi:uroporphyrinogen-III synthase
MRPVLVSRAEPGATHSWEALQKLGIKAIKAPTADILFLEKRLRLNAIAALVFTSTNGVRAYTRASKQFGLPVYCVGTATANLARSFGFDKVLCADGDGQALAALIASQPPQGPLLHIRGDDVGFDLIGGLEDTGIDISAEILYRAVMLTRFKPNVRTALDQSPIVLLYSSKGAERFLKLAGSADLSGVTFVVISKAASMPLRDVKSVEIKIAEQPNQTSLFEALGGLF